MPPAPKISRILEPPAVPKGFYKISEILEPLRSPQEAFNDEPEKLGRAQTKWPQMVAPDY